jgi:hypothetical protein
MHMGSTPEVHLPSGTVIRYADEKAALFFITDASAAGANSYDAWVASPDNLPNAFTSGDLTAINTTMRGRSAAKQWSAFTTGADLPWLKEIDPEWDLIAMPDTEWSERGCEGHIRRAMHELTGPYRRAAVVTKLLHIKRPRLIPICDSYVAKIMGKPAYDADSTTSLILAIREVGRANLEALREVASRLAGIGVVRPLVRILDAMLWFDAPPQGPPGAYALFEDWLVRWHGGALFFGVKAR